MILIKMDYFTIFKQIIIASKPFSHMVAHDIVILYEEYNLNFEG